MATAFGTAWISVSCIGIGRLKSMFDISSRRPFTEGFRKAICRRSPLTKQQGVNVSSDDPNLVSL